MTNEQLYIALGIPSVLVILAWISSFIQNNRLDTKLDTKVESLRSDMRADRKELGEKIDKLREDMFTHFNEFFKTLARHDAQIETMREEKKNP